MPGRRMNNGGRLTRVRRNEATANPTDLFGGCFVGGVPNPFPVCTPLLRPAAVYSIS